MALKLVHEKEVKKVHTEVQKEIELKPAEVVTNLSLDWMMNYRVDQHVAHLAGDSTASNKGLKMWVIIAWMGGR